MILPESAWLWVPVLPKVRVTCWLDWTVPVAETVLPVSPAIFMRVVGVIEMVVGLALLAGLVRLGAYVMGAWLLAIAANLVSTGSFYDLAVRDVEIAIAAYALARLAEARDATAAAA